MARGKILQKLEPFGAGNPEPVFCASSVRLAAPAKILKDKHVRLKFTAGGSSGTNQSWRRSISHNAVGWRLAERVAQEKWLAGDLLHIAFTLDHNEHPEFGGIELSLRDFKTKMSARTVGSPS